MEGLVDLEMVVGVVVHLDLVEVVHLDFDQEAMVLVDLDLAVVEAAQVL